MKAKEVVPTVLFTGLCMTVGLARADSLSHGFDNGISTTLWEVVKNHDLWTVSAPDAGVDWRSPSQPTTTNRRAGSTSADAFDHYSRWREISGSPWALIS